MTIKAFLVVPRLFYKLAAPRGYHYMTTFFQYNKRRLRLSRTKPSTRQTLLYKQLR